jgi:hypothetical protein
MCAGRHADTDVFSLRTAIGLPPALIVSIGADIFPLEVGSAGAAVAGETCADQAQSRHDEYQ